MKLIQLENLNMENGWEITALHPILWTVINKRKCSVRVTISSGEMTMTKVIGGIKMIFEKGRELKLLDVVYVTSI